MNRPLVCKSTVTHDSSVDQLFNPKLVELPDGG